MKNLLLIALLSLTIISTNTQAADEGVKVHGHWTFDIYNQDGSFDRKVEFENSLTPYGSKLLVLLLNKRRALSWNLAIYGTLGPCQHNDGSYVPCYIVESGLNPNNLSTAFDTLTLSTDITAGSGNKFILKGVFTASNGTGVNIESVDTKVAFCQSTPCETPFNGLDGETLTSKTLTQPIPLADGQIVQVTVEISFS